MTIGDKRGVEGMPLKLVIVAILIALTAPSIYGSLGNFQKATSTNILRNQAEEVALIAQELVKSGVGNQRSVKISIPTDGSYLMFGGTTRSEMMSIGFGDIDGNIVRIYLTDPNVLFITQETSGLVVEGPGCQLYLKCIEAPSGCAIEVRT